MFYFRKIVMLAPILIKKSRKHKWSYLAILAVLLFSAFRNTPEEFLPKTRVTLSPPDSISAIDHEMKQFLLRELRLKQFTDSLVNFALSFEGKPYRYGGRSPKGFDCSGYAQYVFNQFGIDLERTSRAQSHQGDPVELEQVKKGDLLFFTGPNKQSRQVGHVGLVISKAHEEIRFVHSSSHGGVKVSGLKGHYEGRILFAKRLLKAE